jgi:polyhydroxyalkanoate synthesis regulator phasin
MNRTAYQNFFIKTEEGKDFIKEILRQIAANHELAEKDPELARDYVQRAKGNREILEHIQSVTAEPKKGKSM